VDCSAGQADRVVAMMVAVGKSLSESGEDVRGAVAEALGVDTPAAAALLSGMEALVEFACVDVAAETPAADTEAAAVTAGLRAVRPLLQRRLQKQIDAIDAQTPRQTRCLQCEAVAQSQGRRSRPWSSITGEIKLTRRYAYCKKCKQGRSLAQEALGISWSPFTPKLEEVCTLMATTVPHGMAVGLVDKLLGLRVSERGMQQMVERRAQHLEATLHQEAEQYAHCDSAGLPVAVQKRPDDSVPKAPEVAYLEMDGVLPMTREELPRDELTAQDKRRQRQAKRDKARGGRGRRYRLVGREVKNAVLYTAEACATESDSRKCLTDKRYVSHLGHWQTFAQHVWVELLRQRFDQAKTLVILSDGAEWIRSLASWLPMPVMLILDLFHVKKRIWEVANALHGERTDAARQWAQTQCQRIEAGAAHTVIAALRFVRPRCKAAQQLVAELTEYLSNNLDRMDYPAYRSMGLRVGSGAVESANYHVTGARLKLQGMRWSEQGAREMAYLRADLFNGRWDDRTRTLRAA
jgi:hypothetical protein